VSATLTITAPLVGVVTNVTWTVPASASWPPMLPGSYALAVEFTSGGAGAEWVLTPPAGACSLTFLLAGSA
jgi:hypothetical protein